MYWGSDDDSPEKTYSVESVNANGTGFGPITLFFGPGSTNRGEMRNIEFDGSGNSVRFEVWKDGYGPLSFALER